MRSLPVDATFCAYCMLTVSNDVDYFTLRAKNYKVIGVSDLCS